MSDTPIISGHAGYTMGPVARWVCVDANSDKGARTVAYVDTIERANRFISTDTELTRLRAREAVLVRALTQIADRWCCQTPGCNTDNPKCDTMVARKALATLDVPDTKEQT